MVQEIKPREQDRDELVKGSQVKVPTSNMSTKKFAHGHENC